MPIITIDNLNFKYGDKEIFKNFNLTIEEGTFNHIVGLNGSGKTTLAKIILGLVLGEGKITIDTLELNKDNLWEIRKKIGVVFENPDNQFVAETVMDDIAFTLENLNYDRKDMRNKIKKIANFLGISDLLHSSPTNLSGGQKQLVALASALVIEPKILILDEALTMVDNSIRKKIYQILLDINKNKHVTIINITHDMDELIYGDNIILLDNGKIILSGCNQEVLKQEKIFTKLGLDLPFMASLSIKLMYYGLLDRIILDVDEMVRTIWK